MSPQSHTYPTSPTAPIMEKVAIEDIEPQSPEDENIPDGAMANSIGDARLLSKALDTTGLAIKTTTNSSPGKASPTHRIDITIRKNHSTFRQEQRHLRRRLEIQRSALEKYSEFHRIHFSSGLTMKTNWSQQSLLALLVNTRRTLSIS